MHISMLGPLPFLFFSFFLFFLLGPNISFADRSDFSSAPFPLVFFKPENRIRIAEGFPMVPQKSISQMR